MDDILAVIRDAVAPLEPGQAAEEAFSAALAVRHYGKGEPLARAGEMSRHLFFVRSGLIRYYYLSDGIEHTGQFFGPGMFAADVLSVTTDVPAVQTFDALEPTVAVLVPVEALRRAYDSDHAFERFGRRMIEIGMAGSQRRTANLLMRSPEERYDDFVRRRPEVTRSVPQYIIASFLGITPESLSRIRNRRLR